MKSAAGTTLDPNDPEIRRAKLVLFLCVIVVLGLAIAAMLLFFQPRTQSLVTRWPNGYPRTETHVRRNELGAEVRHGRFRSWHPNGVLAEEGEYRDGERAGRWRRWTESGVLVIESGGRPTTQ